MKKTILRAMLGAAFLAGAATLAQADAIEGMWMTGDKALVKVSKCGAEFCVDVADGKYKGKRSGKLAPKGGAKYAGTLTQFSTGITFSGEATLNGGSMSLIAKKFGVTVKRDKWVRQ